VEIAGEGIPINVLFPKRDIILQQRREKDEKDRDNRFVVPGVDERV